MSDVQTRANGTKRVTIGIGIGIGILLLVYLAVAFYFDSHFFPKTFINNKDCSMMTVSEAAERIRQDIENYSLTLLDRGGNKIAEISALQAQLEMDIAGQAELLHQEQNIFLWPLMIFQTDSHQFPYELEYSSDKLKISLEAEGLFDPINAVKPQNAYIDSYKEGVGYEIVPETEGTLIDEEKLLEACAEAMKGMQETLDLEEKDCYIQAEIRQDNEELQKQCEQMNLLVQTRITYDWNGFEEIVDGTLIQHWIVVEDGTVDLDEEKVREFVKEKASNHDTYARKRSFVTTLGMELVLPRGAYGWKVDREAETQELIQLIREGAITQREPVYSVTAYNKGSDDIGNSYVEIDLTNQHLYLYIEGEIVLETDFVSGDMAKGNTTPPGIFGITYKTKDAVLRGGDYETPVSYWMPFNGNYGMHDASWRKHFGGDIYLTNGSHGCVNLPMEQAAQIYSYMKKGFPVICYYY